LAVPGQNSIDKNGFTVGTFVVCTIIKLVVSVSSLVTWLVALSVGNCLFTEITLVASVKVWLAKLLKKKYLKLIS
jgi:hypothetical protein